MSDTQHTSGSVIETSNDNFLAPGSTEIVAVSADLQVEKLEAFLADTFPGEVGLTNRQVPEHPVDVAIRLLQGYSTVVDATEYPRCDQEYCNRPAGHGGDCGWVQKG